MARRTASLPRDCDGDTEDSISIALQHQRTYQDEEAPNTTTRLGGIGSLCGYKRDGQRGGWTALTRLPRSMLISCCERIPRRGDLYSTNGLPPVDFTHG